MTKFGTWDIVGACVGLVAVAFGLVEIASRSYARNGVYLLAIGLLATVPNAVRLGRTWVKRRRER
jgi:sulfite exporter TauE/SafE